MKMKEFTKDEKEQILSQAQKFWEMSTQWMGTFFDLVNELERLSRVLLPADLAAKYDQFPDRSALVPPDIYNNLNSLRAAIRAALFRKKPFAKLSIKGQPNFRGAPILKAEQVLQAIYDEENDGKGFASEADKVFYQALYAGTSVAYTHWREEWEKVLLRDEALLPILDKYGNKQFSYRKISEYPATKALDIRRIRVNPNISEVKDIQLIGYHHLEKFGDLTRLNKRPNNHYDFDEKELKESSFDAQKYFEYVPRDGDNSPDTTDINQRDFGDDLVEVQSLRGNFKLFDKSGNDERVLDLIVEIGNSKVLLAAKENDLPIFSPQLFDFAAVDEQTGRLFTMGVVEPARDPFLEQFVKRNQSMDSANRDVYATYVGDESACSELPEYMENAQDRIYKVDAMGAGLSSAAAALSILPRPPLGQDTFGHSEVCKRDVQQTMRLSDYLQGTTPNKVESATGVHELVTGGKSLTEFLIDKLTDTFLRPCALKKMKLWNFFKAHQENMVYAKDGTAYNIAPGEIDLPFGATMETNISITNPAAIRRWVEELPILWNDPYHDPIVVRETNAEIMDLPNRDRLLISQELLELVIDKENNALGSGIAQPVHPLENHAKHIEGHVEYMNQTGAQGLIGDHILEHQQFVQKQNQSLGNTKEMGGNAGNLVQPDSASMKNRPGGKTGAYMPSEARA